MNLVTANMSMSLDGFVEDRAGSVEHVFAWCERGTESLPAPGGRLTFRTAPSTALMLREAWSTTGAIVCGRRLFDLTRGWNGRHPVDAPVFVVTHRPPDDWAHPDAPFTFVSDGVASAIEQAKAAAGERNVAVATPDITRQCLELGLIDGIGVDLVPVLLGAGKPWFAGLADTVELEDPDVIAGDGVIHLFYRVRR